MSQAGPESVTVSIVNDYEVVVRGLWEMLAAEPRLRVVELDSMVHPTVPADVVLFDAFAAEQGVGPDLIRLLAHPNVGRLVVYTWNMDAGLIDLARRAGVAGYLNKRLGAEALTSALLRVAGGEEIFAREEPVDTAGEDDSPAGDWPGRELRLTAREAEVIGLIVQGLTNEQIAKRAFLSINSVKTYIRSAYRKIGVERRSEAILWGIQHGFLPRPVATQPAFTPSGTSPAATPASGHTPD